jgi:hypothetical protein
MASLIEPEDGVPDLVHEADPARLIAAVHDLLEIEKRDSHELKTLGKMLKDVRRTTVWPLLVEVMTRRGLAVAGTDRARLGRVGLDGASNVPHSLVRPLIRALRRSR